MEVEFVNAPAMILIVAFEGTTSRDKAFKELNGRKLNTDTGTVCLNARVHEDGNGSKSGRAMLRSRSTSSALAVDLREWFTNCGTVSTESIRHEAFGGIPRVAWRLDESSAHP